MDTELVVLIVLFVFIILLIFLMYIFLKRIVEKINKVSKEYYLDKVQVYDHLIQEKEKKLNELNEEIAKKNDEINEKNSNEGIANINNVSSGYDVNIKKIDYQDEDILQQIKLVDEKFNLDEEKLIKDFLVKKVKDNNFDRYDQIKKIRARLNSKVCYDLSTKNAKDQEAFIREISSECQDIIDDYINKNKKMNIITFKPYLEKVIKEEDPFVYVYVSDDKKNYNYLSDNILTIQDKKIYRGIMIKYKNKMYDFCIK